MDMEPSQLVRGMDVDIGMGLGDELGGFEVFDAMFAEPNSTTDFFKFCALEDTQQQDMATTSALQGPPSPVSSFGQQHKGYEFAQESWNIGGQQQIQAWAPLSLSASEPTQRPNSNMLLQSGGKPRARKRHDEDEVPQSKEVVHPVVKRRSSTAATTINTGLAPTEAASEINYSFCVTTATAGGWTPAVSQQTSVARRGVQAHQQQGGMVSPLGGAIKVNTDVTSGTMHPPRISVFMSSSRRRGTNNGGGSLPRPTAVSRPSPSMVPTSAPAGIHGHSCQTQLEPTMDRTASAQAQRLKDLRITMRDRSITEKYIVEHNPAVVAMGSPHHPNSTSALLLGDDDNDEEFTAAVPAAAPTLRRASSVGALTISGSGEILSTSPVLSSTGRIIQSCELSDRSGDGGQRRNLVCKVFGSGGSPFMGPSRAGR